MQPPVQARDNALTYAAFPCGMLAVLATEQDPFLWNWRGTHGVPLTACAPGADFYTPPVAAEALAAIGRLSGVGGLAFGGYAQAERCRILLGQEELVEGLRPDPEQVSCKAHLSYPPLFLLLCPHMTAWELALPCNICAWLAPAEYSSRFHAHDQQGLCACWATRASVTPRLSLARSNARLERVGG